MPSKKIILVYPKIDYEENYKYFWTPFSILALAGVLEKRGLQPILFDQNSDPKADWFIPIEPHLDDALAVGFSIMTGGGQIGHALDLARQIREHSPSLPLIWGGPHVSALPEQTAAHDLVDIAVPGQGDVTLADIAASLQTDSPLSGVPGIYIKGKDRRIHFTGSRSFVRKEELPIYPWHLVNPADYLRNDVTINTRTLGYVSSQGCPYRCRFCYEFAAYNAWWSAFEADRVVNDVSQLAEKYQINGVKFYDADFFVNFRRVEALCKLFLEKGLHLNWAGSANPNDILRIQKRCPELMNLIRDTYCTRILMGMESGSDRMLELVDKRVTSAQLREVAKIIADYGIIGSFTFIVAFPGETVADTAATIELMEYVHSLKAQHETRVHIFAPYPGTPLYDTAIQYGFRPHERLEDWSSYDYYLPQTPWADARSVEIVHEYTRLH